MYPYPKYFRNFLRCLCRISPKLAGNFLNFFLKNIFSYLISVFLKLYYNFLKFLLYITQIFKKNYFTVAQNFSESFEDFRTCLQKLLKNCRKFLSFLRICRVFHYELNSNFKNLFKRQFSFHFYTWQHWTHRPTAFQNVILVMLKSRNFFYR